MSRLLCKFAKRAGLTRALLLFIGVQLVLTVPVLYVLLMTQPYEMHARLNGVASFDEMQFTVDITGEYVSYTDAYSSVAMPAGIIPAEVTDSPPDYKEIYNYLALYNGYFIKVLLPVTLVAGAVLFLSQAMLYFCACWLYGLTRKMTTYMTMAERFTVCVYASLPALFPGVVLGFFVPVFHLFIFELIMLFTAYKVLEVY
jgi:hypothetical protein